MKEKRKPMVIPKRGKRIPLSIFAFAILSRPFFSVGFLPPNRCNRHQQGAFSSTSSRDQNYGQINRLQEYYDTIARATALHGLPETLAGVASLAAGFAGWLYIDGAGDRDRRRMREEEEARIKANEVERARLAYIEPREYWKQAELAPYDGSRDEDGPILLSADGLVFNVYKGRNFYLPGCEYHIFAGRDATRLLARNKLEEETEEEAKKPLNVAERAYLATWIYTFKGKYDIVGKLEGFDPKTTKL
jgi:membrane-associated progesterone receptor component